MGGGIKTGFLEEVASGQSCIVVQALWKIKIIAPVSKELLMSPLLSVSTRKRELIEAWLFIFITNIHALLEMSNIKI